MDIDTDSSSVIITADTSLELNGNDDTDKIHEENR